MFLTKSFIFLTLIRQANTGEFHCMLNGLLFKILMYKTNKKFWLQNVGGRIFRMKLSNLTNTSPLSLILIILRLIFDSVDDKNDLVLMFICLFIRKCSIRLQARCFVSLRDIIWWLPLPKVAY